MSYFGLLIAFLFCYMSFWFVVSCLKKRNDVADVAWGLGFILLVWLSMFISGSYQARSIVVAILVTVWGLRLSWHIYRRNKDRPEDYRYLAWRREWGAWFYVRSYFQVYLLQGLFLFLIAMPFLIINRSPNSSIGILDFLGGIIWLLGFCFEAIADWQLAQFMRNPSNKGKIMQGGLWAYSRHPNYFGEVTQWWGIWVIALSVPGGLISVIGPITLTILILKVSGIPMLEKKMALNPAFMAYKKRVGKFFPRRKL